MGGRGRNPYVFPGRPRQPLSTMAMAMLMRRMGAGEFTVHGFRTSFRTWIAEEALVRFEGAKESVRVPFEVAEHCLAHAVGNETSRSYNRSNLLELRRPVMSAWANYVEGKPCDNVVSLKLRIAPRSDEPDQCAQLSSPQCL
jgi:integrase